MKRFQIDIDTLVVGGIVIVVATGVVANAILEGLRIIYGG